MKTKIFTILILGIVLIPPLGFLAGCGSESELLFLGNGATRVGNPKNPNPTDSNEEDPTPVPGDIPGFPDMPPVGNDEGPVIETDPVVPDDDPSDDPMGDFPSDEEMYEQIYDRSDSFEEELSPSDDLIQILKDDPEWEGLFEEGELCCPFYRLRFDLTNNRVRMALYEENWSSDACYLTTVPFRTFNESELTASTEMGLLRVTSVGNELIIELMGLPPH